jgi:hypothetical protein
MSSHSPRGPYPGLRRKSKMMVWTRDFDFCVLPTTRASANDDVLQPEPPHPRRKGTTRRN